MKILAFSALLGLPLFALAQEAVTNGQQQPDQQPPAEQAASEAEQAAPITLRSMGAKGDGKTDDREAIIKALEAANGGPVDGEGATYAVRGNIEVTNSVYLRNATFVQTLPPVEVKRFIPSASSKKTPVLIEPDALIKTINGLPYLKADVDAMYDEDPQLEGEDLEKVNAMANLKTLYFHGVNYAQISVKLEKVKVDRGMRADQGDRGGSAGIYITDANPVVLTDVEVTGNGKGFGININASTNLKLTRVNVHDILWALYDGDVMPPIESLRKDWVWNNNPIYEYRPGPGRFVRYRVQEQLSGIMIGNCDNIEIVDCRVAHLGTMIEGKFYAWQADGMTIGRVNNLSIKNTTVSEVWEGIDLTGGPSDGFAYDNVHITDCFSFGFKIAHPKINGKFTNCVAERCGLAGFVMGPECENIELKDCQSLDSGSNGFWPGPAGIKIQAQAGLDQPRNVRIENCTVRNAGAAQGKMDVGILLESGADARTHEISASGCHVSGARQAYVGVKSSN